MVCISTATFTIQLNGGDYRNFQGRRGLRQGDPLSPLLFVLVMEYLSRLFQEASSHAEFKFHPNYKYNRMVHLMFANDLIVCSATKITLVQRLMTAFHRFSQSSGLIANREKSQRVMGGCNHRQRQSILAVTGNQEGTLPFRCLGVPISSNTLSKLECSMLVDKITKRIRVWATKTTSYKGRVTLINSVLMGIFSFWANIFIIPQGAIKEVENYIEISFGVLMKHIKKSLISHGMLFASLRKMGACDSKT